MTTGIIGHTGFVGSNLAGQFQFDTFFNSANIQTIGGKRFESLVCAGLPAEKWKANRDPDSDLSNVMQLLGHLAGCSADRMVVISTVDVYPHPYGVDEQSEISAAANHAYGRHRLLFEREVGRVFPTVHYIRLPALFGTGLKKNALYDFIHDNDTDRIHSEATYQFYGVNNLWNDICIAVEHHLHIVNLATEPLTVREMTRAVLGLEFDNHPHEQPERYDCWSRHAGFYGKEGHYLYHKAEVLREMKSFVQAEMRGRR